MITHNDFSFISGFYLMYSQILKIFIGLELITMVSSLFVLWAIIIPNLYVSEGLDYHKLVQIWPRAFCSIKNRNCLRTPNNFTLHGLWPDNYIGQLSNCAGAPAKDITVTFLSFLYIYLKSFYFYIDLTHRNGISCEGSKFGFKIRI